MMTDMIAREVPSVSPSSGCLATADLRNFFDRLAAGDYHTLAKELRISGKPTHISSTVLEETNHHLDAELDAGNHQDPDASICSIDSVDSAKFQPTPESLNRAVSLFRGDEPPLRGDQKPELEEDEAYQFTFRLMIHKLYSIKDFAKMVEDVVRTSQERFRPLSSELLARGRQPSLSFSSFVDDSFAYGHRSPELPSSPTSPSEASSMLPSSPSSSWMADRLPSPQLDTPDEGELRAVKKRIVGRKLSVVDGSTPDEESVPSWVYDTAVSSIEPYAPFFEFPMSPAADSPARNGNAGQVDEGDCISRKRRFSFLAARGF